MGGLGPTEDDLTRECVAETLGRPLKRHARIVEDLRARFAARGWKMSENNERQGDVIDGADVLDNKRGSAPGSFFTSTISTATRSSFSCPVLRMNSGACLKSTSLNASRAWCPAGISPRVNSRSA